MYFCKERPTLTRSPTGTQSSRCHAGLAGDDAALAHATLDSASLVDMHALLNESGRLLVCPRPTLKIPLPDEDMHAFLNESGGSLCYPWPCFDVPPPGAVVRGGAPITPATLPPQGVTLGAPYLGGASVSERSLAPMLTDPGYPSTATIPQPWGELGVRQPHPDAISAFRPHIVSLVDDVPMVCAQAAPGHLDGMHVHGRGFRSAFRQARAALPDAQASRAVSVVNFSITLDTHGAMPSPFGGAADTATLFQAPPPWHTPFAGPPPGGFNLASRLPPADPGAADVERGDAEHEYARIASAYETVTASFAQPLVAPVPTVPLPMHARGPQLGLAMFGGMGDGSDAPVWVDAAESVELPASDDMHGVTAGFG